MNLVELKMRPDKVVLKINCVERSAILWWGYSLQLTVYDLLSEEN